MSRILLVDDALDDQRIITSVLNKGNEVVCASTLGEAREWLARGEFDVILLDVQFPDGDGFQFCASLQAEETRHIPVIFLTGRSDIADLTMGFSLGAEDYLTKPYNPRELKVRIEARIRKLSQRRADEQVLQVGDLKIIPSRQKVWVAGDTGDSTLDLTPLEFRLLCYFARHLDHVLSRERLLSAIWSDSLSVLDRTVDMHVSNLRRKLSPSELTVRSVHGIGYRLTRPENTAPRLLEQHKADNQQNH